MCLFKFCKAKPDWLRQDPKLIIDLYFLMLPTGISYLKNYVLKSVKVPVFTQKHRAKLASA